jgi:hypothetical protein
MMNLLPLFKNFITMTPLNTSATNTNSLLLLNSLIPKSSYTLNGFIPENNRKILKKPSLPFIPSLPGETMKLAQQIKNDYPNTKFIVTVENDTIFIKTTQGVLAETVKCFNNPLALAHILALSLNLLDEGKPVCSSNGL